ncbi:MAG: hypothetical protein LBE59_02095 [Nevskiaceae bacterium]|jgi:hypothetical protein|nr:hypothetical protein [Nevskiaceae bacterium]
MATATIIQFPLAGQPRAIQTTVTKPKRQCKSALASSYEIQLCKAINAVARYQRRRERDKEAIIWWEGEIDRIRKERESAGDAA